MNHYPLAIYCDHPEVHFEIRTAARLARVSEAFTAGKAYALRMSANSNWFVTCTRIWGWIWRLWIWCCGFGTKS